MSTFRQLALRVIAESGIEKEPMEDVLSPEYVLRWLKSRYQKAIDSMPFGSIMQQAPVGVVTTLVKSDGTVAVVQGSNQVVGTGTSFVLGDESVPPVPFKKILIAGTNTWFDVIDVSGQTLVLNMVFPGESASGLTYYLVNPVVAIPTIRWITAVVGDSWGELEELAPSKLNELDPHRNLTPSQPRIYLKHTIHPTSGVRFIELYPYPDQIYALTIHGYASLDEPTLTSSPHREIDDELLITGGIASAFQFRAQLAAGRNENDKSLQFLRLSSAKQKEFDDYIKQVTNRDSHDTEQARVRVRITHRQHLLGTIHDPILDAYDEVWNR